MEANVATMEKLVNTVADRIGIAVDKAGPLAEEVVRQYQLRAIVGAIAAVLLGLGCIVLVVYSSNSDSDKPTLGEVAGLLGCLIAVVWAGTSILQAVAPLPSILGL